MSLFETEEINNATEELIVVGMIHSRQFLAVVAQSIQTRHFENKECRLLAELCLDFFEDNKDCPGNHILDLVDSIRDEIGSGQKLVDALLKKLDKKYGDREIHPQVLETTYSDWAKTRTLRLGTKEINALVAKGRVHEAELRMEQLRQHLSHHSDDHILATNIHDENVPELITYTDKVIMKFHNDLDDFMPPQSKNRFYTFMGGKKSGKSQWLEYIAITGVENDLNVLVFTFELTRGEYLHRLWTGLLGCTIDLNPDNPDRSRVTTEELPIFDCKKNRAGTCERRECPDNDVWENPKEFTDGTWEACSHCINRKEFEADVWKQLEEVKVIRTKKEFEREKTKWRRQFNGDIRVVAAEPGTLTVKDIRDKVERMKLIEGFIPDLIVIDYADNLISEKSYGDKRHELGSIWLQLSALAKSGYLVWTASQTNRAGWGVEWITDSMIAEDASKLMVVDGMISINEHMDRKNNINEKYWGTQRLRAHDYRNARLPHFDIKVLNDFARYMACIECCKI